MLYAVIADIHGNFPALEAVLADARQAGAERFLFAGDYFTDLPWTEALFETFRSLQNADFVSGNREWYMDALDPSLRIRKQTVGLYLTQEALGEDGRAWCRNLPRSLTLRTPDGRRRILIEHICEELNGALHAGRGKTKLRPSVLSTMFPDRPASHEEVTDFARTALMSQSLSQLRERAGADVVIHGHNHMQYAVELDGVLYLNPGACGQPLDHDTRAPYTLLRYEDGRFSVEERRVPYDRERVARETRASAFYKEAGLWCELVMWMLATARESAREFFRLLSEEEERLHPQTDAEYNEAFRRAIFRFLGPGSVSESL